MSHSPSDHDGTDQSNAADYPLVPLQPPSVITAEDLVPAPYVANAVIFPSGYPADVGLGIRHIENHLFITFWPWRELSFGDAYLFYIGDERFPLAEDDIRFGQESQALYSLAIRRDSGSYPTATSSALSAGRCAGVLPGR